MINHAWTVLCDRTIVDRDSNNVSMDVIERIQIPPLAQSDVDENGNPKAAIAITLTLVSYWYRDSTETESGQARMSIKSPRRTILSQLVALDLQQPALRTFSRLVGLPVDGPGRYAFLVELENPDGTWKPVASVPLFVEFNSGTG